MCGCGQVVGLFTHAWFDQCETWSDPWISLSISTSRGLSALGGQWISELMNEPSAALLASVAKSWMLCPQSATSFTSTSETEEEEKDVTSERNRFWITYLPWIKDTQQSTKEFKDYQFNCFLSKCKYLCSISMGQATIGGTRKSLINIAGRGVLKERPPKLYFWWPFKIYSWNLIIVIKLGLLKVFQKWSVSVELFRSGSSVNYLYSLLSIHAWCAFRWTVVDRHSQSLTMRAN